MGRLREVVAGCCPHASVSAFGSLRSGLAIYSSDVDVGLENATRHDLYSVFLALSACGWARGVEHRGRASVPVVVLEDRATGLSADISVQDARAGGHGAAAVTGAITTRAVAAMVSEWPCVFRPLAVFLKAALNEAGLNKPFTGGLGSFKLCALIAHYLERRHAARPPLPMDVGACLQGLLRFVAHDFDFERTARAQRPP